MFTFTYLAPKGPNGWLHAGKTFNSQFKAEPIKSMKYHGHAVASYGSLREFEHALSLLSDPDSGLKEAGNVFIIRGKVMPEYANEKIARKYVPDNESDPPMILSDSPNWVCIDIDESFSDIDNLPERSRAIWCSWSNAQKSEYLINLAKSLSLPEWLISSDFIAQTSSSSFLLSSTWRGHLWFFLDRPVHDHSWKERILKGKHVDRSLFNPVQPHYIAAPRFLVGTDPIKGHRIVYVDNGRPVASVPSDVPSAESESATLVKEAENTRKKILALHSNHNAMDLSDSIMGVQKWSKIVSKIKSCGDGERHKKFWAIYHETNQLMLERVISPSKWEEFRSLWLGVSPSSPWTPEKVDAMMLSALRYAENALPPATGLTPKPVRDGTVA